MNALAEGGTKELVRGTHDDPAWHVHGEFLTLQLGRETAGDRPAPLGRAVRRMRKTGEFLRIHSQRTNRRSSNSRIDAYLKHIGARLDPDAGRKMAGARLLGEDPTAEFVPQPP